MEKQGIRVLLLKEARLQVQAAQVQFLKKQPLASKLPQEVLGQRVALQLP